jgi:hypothetical protein
MKNTNFLSLGISQNVATYEAAVEMSEYLTKIAQNWLKQEKMQSSLMGGLDESGHIVLDKDGKATGMYQSFIDSSYDAADNNYKASNAEAIGSLVSGVVSGATCAMSIGSAWNHTKDIDTKIDAVKTEQASLKGPDSNMSQNAANSDSNANKVKMSEAEVNNLKEGEKVADDASKVNALSPQDKAERKQALEKQLQDLQTEKKLKSDDLRIKLDQYQMGSSAANSLAQAGGKWMGADKQNKAQKETADAQIIQSINGDINQKKSSSDQAANQKISEAQSAWDIVAQLSRNA